MRDDYLEHQLYVASKSGRIKRQKKKSWIIVTLAFLSLSFIFYRTDNKLLMYYFGGFSLLSLIFYPSYQKRRYLKHYQKHITDIYKNRLNELNTIVLNEISITCSDISGETKINSSMIEEIIETNKYIYLKIKTGQYLIIPKLKIEDTTIVQKYLISLADKLSIAYNQELKWKWI